MEEIKIAKLVGDEGWTLWKFQVKVILKASSLWDIVRGTEVQPTTEGTELMKWKGNDAKAQKILVVSMGEEPLMHVINCETAAEMYTTLESVYEQKSETSIHLLQQQFFQYVKNPEDNIAMHIAKLQKIAKQLEDLGEKISENMLITKILMTLPEQYNHFFASWEATSREQRTLKTLTSRLCMEESRLDVHSNKPEAFVAKRFNKANFEKPKGKCFICKKYGHWKRHCPNKRKGVNSLNGDAFISEVMFVKSNITEEYAWYMDSGASEHMTYRKEWFQTYVKLKTPKDVRIADGSVVQAYGKGVIVVEAYDGNDWKIKHLADVLYVPDIKLNLFSCNACLDKGYVLRAHGNDCSFEKDGKVCLQGTRKSAKLFKLHLKVNIAAAEANTAVKNDSLQLWHERMCHQNKDQVKKVLKKHNIPFSGSDFFCESCIMGKQHRHPFVESKNRASVCGELVHTDLCGPMQEASHGGARYMLLFRDDYSNYRYVYCIKSKADVANKMKHFLYRVESEIQKKVRCIRSDNGLEFVNKDVSKILNDYRVLHQKSTPYTPEHNGRAERDMRTIVEAARSMIHAKSLSLKFWGEAVQNVIFTLNRTCKTKTDQLTPYDLWFGHSPDILNLRVFGSDAFVHIPQEKRRKLNAKSKKGVFVGYEEYCKGYRIWLPHERKIEISRDVIIREENYEAVIPYNDETNAGSHIHLQTEVEKSEIATEDESNNDLKDAQSHDMITTDEKFVKRYNTRSSRRDKNAADIHFAYLAQSDEPTTFQEAMSGDLRTQWKRAMDEEIESLVNNKTWDLVSLPDNKKTISNKWVYKVKRNEKGEIERFKARLVARGFTQKFGIDYDETFSPVAKFTSLRIIFALSCEYGLKIKQFDVKTAFLYGNLEKEIYMHQPMGYEDNSGKVCKLNKSIYGLKQASRCWNRKFTQMLEAFNLKPCQADPCVFIGDINKSKLILAIYIDDGIIAAHSSRAFDDLITYLKGEFEIKVFDTIFYLGMQITHEEGKIFIKQDAFARKVLQRFNMLDTKPVSVPIEGILQNTKEMVRPNYPYREAVGSLMYLSLLTRPDLAFAVSYVSRFLDTYQSEHIVAVKRIFKYLQGTINKGICFAKSNDLSLNCYSDSDFAGDVCTRRSTGGYVIMFCGGPVSWSSKIQPTVALSTTEAEYMAACESVKELIWVRRLLSELCDITTTPNLFLDNQSAINLVKNPQYHKRTKHIEVKVHFIREVYEGGGFTLKYVPTNEQLADIFTKPLKRQNFNKLKCLLNIK